MRHHSSRHRTIGFSSGQGAPKARKSQHDRAQFVTIAYCDRYCNRAFQLKHVSLRRVTFKQLPT